MHIITARFLDDNKKIGMHLCFVTRSKPFSMNHWRLIKRRGRNTKDMAIFFHTRFYVSFGPWCRNTKLDALLLSVDHVVPSVHDSSCHWHFDRIWIYHFLLGDVAIAILNVTKFIWLHRITGDQYTRARKHLFHLPFFLFIYLFNWSMSRLYKRNTFCAYLITC